MIPSNDVVGEPVIPAGARFWVPQLTYEDEGFGFFRNVWTVIDVTPAEAREVIEKERILAKLVDDLSTTADQFDRLAHFAESWDPDEPEDSDDLLPDECKAMESALHDLGRFPLESLELGVAGLVYAMSAAGAVTAASCRGHPTEHAWSTVPVVYFATGEAIARSLEPLVETTGCVFSADSARHELLIVGSRSIENTMRLAQTIVTQL